MHLESRDDSSCSEAETALGTFSWACCLPACMPAYIPCPSLPARLPNGKQQSLLMSFIVN